MQTWEVIAVALVLAVIASIGWSTLRTGMPPMPSLGRGRRAMIEAVDDADDSGIVDFGSGWGTLVLPLARRFPERAVAGYELSWLPWAFSSLMAKLLGLNNARFYRRDFRHADLSGMGVVLCYLMPAGMTLVCRRLERDPGDVHTLVSHHFAVEGWEPVNVRRLDDLYQTPIYTYRLPDSLPLS